MVLYSLLNRFYVTLHLNNLQQNVTDIKVKSKFSKHRETEKFDAKILKKQPVFSMLLYVPFESQALQVQVWGI